MSTLKLERISHVSLKKLETIKNVRKIREKKKDSIIKSRVLGNIRPLFETDQGKLVSNLAKSSLNDS